MNAILEKLKNHKYWNRIVSDDTIAVVLCGSRRIGIVDERSDYDIIVIQHNFPANDEINEYLICDGKKIHWYYRQPLDYFNYNETTSLWSVYSICTASLLTDDGILYVNPLYSNEWEQIRQFCLNNRAPACKLYFDKSRTRIEKIVAQGEIREEDYSKFLYQYCVVSHIMLNQQMTVRDKQLLGELKRIRWKAVTDECELYCVERLKLVQKELWLDEGQE